MVPWPAGRWCLEILAIPRQSNLAEALPVPQLSLVVCLYRERDMLARLLEQAAGCFDDLVVVHDGPDEEDVRSLVEAHGGRFFERMFPDMTTTTGAPIPLRLMRFTRASKPNTNRKNPWRRRC